jgi:hypothetical protein
MAIKALSGSSTKISSAKLLGGSSSSANKINPNSLASIGSGGITISKEDLGFVKQKVIKVRDLLKESFLLKKSELDKQKKTAEKKRFSEKEQKLEAKPDQKEDKKEKGPQLPKLGFLDRVKQFLYKLLLGFIVYRLIDHLPKLISFAKVAFRVGEWIVDMAGKLLDGVVTFIDWGYKAVNSVRGFIKSVGGDKTLELFDKFTKAFTVFVNGALIVSMIMLKSRGLWKTLIGEGAKKGAAGILGRGVGRAGTRLGIAVAGKAGGMAVQGVAKTLSKVLQKIPIIGGLIDFGINILLGEDPGRAAARAAGATAGGALAGLVAGTVGSVVPFAGTALGAFLGSTVGSFLGDWAGGALYDAFAGASKKMAGGGVATRGGKLVGGAIKRTVGKTKVKREVKITKDKLKPGVTIGGESKISKMFPKGPDDGTVSQMGYIEKSYNITSDIPFFGPIFALAIKTLTGQKPSATDYQRAGAGLNSWMNNTFSTDTMKMGAFAGGGEVNAEMFMGGEDLSNIIAKSLEDNISSKVDDSINELMKQLMLKPMQVEKKDINQQTPGENLGPGGNASDAVGGARLFMSEGFPMLAAAILAGNVQAESAWRGQRTPWVLNDGAGTNKGLISWNRSRITNAEKFLGKPLETASNGEQVKWIKEELRQYGLLDEFMDSKSTEAQLKAASYKYIGWGIEGDRWKQSSRILAALQKGEMGSFTSAGAGGGGGNLGAGYGSGGSKIAGALGDYMKQVKIPTGEIHQHPKHPGWAKRSYKSYHNEGRAIDLGGYGPAHPSSGGTDEQAPILRALVAWNKQKGVTPVEVIHGSPAFRGFGKYESGPNDLHSHHVHVAYAKGGLVDGVTYAMLGERGKEFVIDADSTAALENTFPGFLSAINKANYEGAIGVLRGYAEYEFGGGPSEIEIEEPEPQIIPIGKSTTQNRMSSDSGGGSEDPYESMAMSQ